jgi:hypothetical protein
MKGRFLSDPKSVGVGGGSQLEPVWAGSPCPRWPVGFEQTTTIDSVEGTRLNSARYFLLVIPLLIN